MDPLSAAASVIATIQITNAVLVGFYRLQSQIKDAEKEITQAISEIEDLAVVLTDLHDILQVSKAENAIPSEDLNGDNGPLESITKVLNEISRKLAPLSRPGLKTKFRWPFESKGIQRMLGTIQSQKSTLQLALSSRQTKMLVQQFDNMTDLHDSLENMGDCLVSTMTAVGTQVLHSMNENAEKTKQEEVLKWYKSCDPEQNHQQSRERHDPDTGKWLIESEEFQSWLTKNGRSLWLHGIPGAGKTILCSTIISYIQSLFYDEPNVRITYYYFDFGDSNKQSVSSLLKSIIFQLISSAQSIAGPALELYEKCHGLQEPSLDELMGVLLSEWANFESTVLAIDALDECPEHERRLFFKHLFKNPLPNGVRIVITSRKEPDIESALKDTASHIISIQSSLIDADVRLHVNNAISRDPTLRKWKSDIRQEILDGIVHGSQGMFRWAICQLDTMKKCITPAMVRKELKAMPETLDQMYDRILQSIPRLHQQYVQSAMHWLAFSARPLLLSEVAEAVTIEPKLGKFDPSELRLMDENLILDLCGTLTTVSKIEYSTVSTSWLSEKIKLEHGYVPRRGLAESYTVSLSHYSVKEYIVSRRLRESSLACYSTSERVASKFLAECCLIYILDFNGGEICVPPRFGEYPLVQYSSRFWMEHWKTADQYTECSVLQTLLRRLFNPSNINAYVNWLNVWNPDSVSPGSRLSWWTRTRSARLQPQPLYYTSMLGHYAVSRWLHEEGCDINAREGILGSAFAAAAFGGHARLVGYFLEAGADPNLQGLKFGSVLQTAAVGGSLPVVQMLLDAGADVNVEGGEYNTALVAAASLEHDKILALLLEYGADLKIESRYHGSALYQAASTGDMKMVVALLAAGADVNHIGDSDGTPLYAAATSGSAPLVQTLLRRGAEVNLGGFGEFGYPLVVAAHNGSAQIVRILLRAGADPNLSNGHRGTTALVAAIESRDMPTFRAIFESGADPNVFIKLYMNAFHAALWTGEWEMAKTLLKDGAEFEDRAFLYAIEIAKDDSYFMNTLLEKAPKIDAHAGNYGSALHIAIRNAPEEAIWRLLERKPWIHAIAEDGSPLAVAIEVGLTPIATELIRRGADINRRGKLGTPLDAACRRGNIERAKLLLENGADVNSGRGSAAHRVIDNNNETMLHFLVKHGAELNLVADDYNCTLVQEAAKKNNLSMLKLLLELGADINGPPGEEGETIHYALSSGDESMARFVLDNGAKISDSDPEHSVLCKALQHGLKQLLPVLLEKGAEVDQTRFAKTALGLSFENDDHDTIQLLLDHGANFANVGAEVLIEAVRDKPLNDVKQLLDHGMDPNCHTKWQTPLAEAAKKGRREALELLLEYGGDLNLNIEVCRGALAEACDDDNLALASYLLSQGADPNLIRKSYRYPLYDAARKGNLEMLDLLLEHGADRNINAGDVFAVACYGGEKVITRLLMDITTVERGIYLDICLQGAAYSTNLKLCSWLLEQGANINSVGEKYGSPLQAAVSDEQVYVAAAVNNRRLIIDLLLSSGADVNASGPKGSALQIALSNRQSKSANTFLDAGADINVCGGELHSPLQAAARYTQKLLPRLLSMGADVNAVGGKYGTALHAAAYTHDLESISLLLSHGAEIHIQAGKYGDVLQAASKENAVCSGGFTSERDSVEALKLLHAHGASTRAQGGKYGTSLQLAAKSGNLQAVKWLLAHGADPWVQGGKYGSAMKAAVKKERWGVISYLEQHFPGCAGFFTLS